MTADRRLARAPLPPARPRPTTRHRRRRRRVVGRPAAPRPPAAAVVPALHRHLVDRRDGRRQAGRVPRWLRQPGRPIDGLRPHGRDRPEPAAAGSRARALPRFFDDVRGRGVRRVRAITWPGNRISSPSTRALGFHPVDGPGSQNLYGVRAFPTTTSRRRSGRLRAGDRAGIGRMTRRSRAACSSRPPSLVIAGLALLVWRGSGGRSPSTLTVGDCFDVPTAGEQIEDIRTRPARAPMPARCSIDDAASRGRDLPDRRRLGASSSTRSATPSSRITRARRSANGSTSATCTSSPRPTDGSPATGA